MNNHSFENFDHFYTEFNEANPDLIHMAGHSHHYWPDITRKGISEAYNDALTMVDLKWNKIFGEIVPKTQELIAGILNFGEPANIAFAPNTHELLMRLISCLDAKKQKRILTTKHEFHSANRQFMRLNEEDDYIVDFVEVEDIENKLRESNYDLIFISHVFFDSGIVLDEKIIQNIIQLKSDAFFVLDSYHSFCALDFDLQKYENDLFYLAGSYKYAQAGEGLCFITIPKGLKLRPINTGWFASFETLESPSSIVDYSPNGYRLSGSTRDFTPHYRFNYIWQQFLDKKIDIKVIDQYIKKLQKQFLDLLPNKSAIIQTDLAKIGHFITFTTNSEAHSKELFEKLYQAKILTDYRGKSLRFGFGMHLNALKIETAVDSMKNIDFFN